MAEHGYDELVRYLRALPVGEEIGFSDDGAMPVPGVHTHWVDAFVPAICEALGLNWCWTIVGPDDDEHDSDDRTTLVVDHDREVWSVWDDNHMTSLADGALAVVAGERPDEAAMARLDRIAAESADRRIEHRPGWSSERLEAALAAWAARHAGRVDLRFRFDQTIGSSPLVARTADVADRAPDDPEGPRPWPPDGQSDPNDKGGDR